MVGIILASHGELATGILQSATMIFGEQANVKACTLMPSEGPEDIKRKMEEAVASFDTDEIVFMIDLWGGTPFNQASALIEGHQDKWAILTGLNLPMLIEAFAARFSSEVAHEIASKVLVTAREGVKALPEELEPEVVVSEAAPTQKQGAIPEGTVIGDGKIKYVLARIDTRLLHGQVATAWTKSTNPDRIIVVSDSVAKDDLRRNMIEQAAPPGVKANVVPINKMIEVSKDPRFGGMRALLLFETPQDVVRVLEGGMDLKEVNLGSIAHSTGKVVVTRAVAMDNSDLEALETIKNMGVSVDVRKVPADSSENFDNMLKKAKDELAKIGDKK
ncbi:PTS mannose transporter subunit IIAB [Erysipelothrix sp. HDW6A]|uniref:mannose/fructose/sorbose PTS transporter subunit IIA n=1 Tax=Erysipelothrix sp. HDW6A TaxID=2714928 RepID=UPI00140C16F5|nr:mannose/fructose/sorbose PTS transporter subunit IIA [Erysipelothrix sp. HDW6A]QIK57628.1 PTS mannose transporter subunit IIAB [Erysipelothrix sp. HDW6A]